MSMNYDFEKQYQTPAEFQKNEMRIKDLIAACEGDKEKEIAKAKRDANKIKTPEKAYNRGFVAKEMGYDHIFDVFFERAYEIRGVNKYGEKVGVGIAEHREHKLEKVLNKIDEENSDL